MIEPSWFHLKRVITKRGAPASRIAAEEVWIRAWKDLEQKRIQTWIQQIMRHVKKIIELEDGNDYREGEFDTDINNERP